MILVNDTTLYVPDQHTAALYEKSSFYDAGYKVEVTEMEITSAGKFSFVLPDYLDASATVKLRTVDALSRCSLQTKVGVKQALPRTPQVAGVSNLTKKVKVYTKELCTRASVKINSKKYSSDSAVYSSEKGYCYTVKIPRTDSTSVLKVYLTNTVGNSSSVKIRPIEKAPNKPKLDTIKANQKKITGTVDVIGSSETNTVKNTGTKVYIFVRGKKCAATIKQDGSFVVKFKKLKLRKKDKVVCIAKNNNGNSLKRVVYVK
jgi:hypothetical protein